MLAHQLRELGGAKADIDLALVGDLITGKVLRPLVVRSLPRGSFAAWMKARGMNDAQSKVPRLANDRRYVEGLADGGTAPYL